MKFYSTNKHAAPADFREATIAGQAPDKGLHFPEKIPLLEKDWVNNIADLSREEIAYQVISPYVGESIPAEELKQIIKETISFPIPLVQIEEGISSLELFHGPTLAFKDMGARFMSRCLGYFTRKQQGIKKKSVTVLVATSGDTGGAVADGFYEVDGVEVIILYPSGKVSPVQEKQLTTHGKNILALEIEGSFDDCQSIVKQAFTDEQITSSIFLTSANSINIARWLPQQFYYFFAWQQWKDKNNPPVISVPSGNFGNICAGLLAMQSGLPVRHFIAACNSNDIVSPYLRSEKWNPVKAIPTISNAMDVGNPSNFVRILELFNHEFQDLKKNLSSCSVSDEQTVITIKNVFDQTGYLLDPHGAVGYYALQQYLQDRNESGFFLETAHPVKFPGAVETATGIKVPVPVSVASIMDKEKRSVKMPADFKIFKELILSRHLFTNG